ncbi:hypothetical protein Tco_0915531, partial [Tanacetum coccineum]
DAPELGVGGGYDGAEVQAKELYLQLKGLDSSEERCELMYGFLPCSSNIPSHIFLIVIYEYLLYHGESYAGGDGRIFSVLSQELDLFSSISQLLDSLHDSLETNGSLKMWLVDDLDFSIWTCRASEERRLKKYLVAGAAYTDDRIQKRRLEYAEVEQKVEMYVPFYEVQALILDREKHLILRQKEMEKMMKHPEENSQETMTKEKFYDTSVSFGNLAADFTNMNPISKCSESGSLPKLFD